MKVLAAVFSLLLVGVQVQQLNSQSIASKPALLHSHSIAASRTLQDIDLLLSGADSNQRILLMLNNNRSEDLVTKMQIFDVNGRAYNLPEITLLPRESRLINFNDVLSGAGVPRIALGYLDVQYNGILMELGAQLTLYPERYGIGVDSPRSLSVDFNSARRAAAFWIPQKAKAKVALTNVSDQQIDAHLRCGLADPAVTIGPHETSVQEVDNSTNGLLKGAHSSACDISFDGSSDALRIAGEVKGENYATPIRFYDPASSTAPSLTAVGVDTASSTALVIYNTTAVPVHYTPVVSNGSQGHAADRVALAPNLLRPFGVTSVDINTGLQHMRNQGIGSATVTMISDAPNGSLIGSLSQKDSSQLVEDVPLRTSNPPRTDRGSYPIRWTGDYTNKVYISNTASASRGFRAIITAGSIVYVLPLVTLEPGESVVYDPDQLRNESTPDIRNQVLPKDAFYGKFLWSELSNGKQTGLLGRASLSSLSDKRKSSFSCGEVCDWVTINSVYYNPGYKNLSDTAIADTDLLYTYESVNIPMIYYPYGFADYYYQNVASVDNPDILQLSQTPLDPYSARITALGPGSTTIRWFDLNTYNVYAPAAAECDTVTAAWYDSWDITISPCASTSSVAGVDALPLSLHPTYKTGIGGVSKIHVGDATNSIDYDGAQISEVLGYVGSDCPAAIGDPRLACTGSGTFTVGSGVASSIYPGPPVHNQFYDFHVSVNDTASLLPAGAPSCTITCNQRYYCKGSEVGNFILNFQFSSGTASGGTAVTNVSVTEF